MNQENKKTLSIIEQMKLKAQEQKMYGGTLEIKEAQMQIKDCPNCGAGRAKQDGLTHCAYCGFEFMSVELSNGLNIKKEDNSKKI